VLIYNYLAPERPEKPEKYLYTPAHTQLTESKIALILSPLVSSLERNPKKFNLLWKGPCFMVINSF